MELTCAVQQYAWGMQGKSSTVAQLAQAMQQSFSIDENSTYAELWMGTHPNGPSVIKDSGETLSSYIAQQPACLGKTVTEKFGQQLPFLFKVLSVNKALSIQAHPNKSHAEELHKSRPDVYKDPNHKPEMTIALTPFLALCGFRTPQEIITFFDGLPELVRVVGAESVAAFKAAPSESTLRACFQGLMTADKDLVATALTELKERLLKMESGAETYLTDMLVTLTDEYPGDGGCFALYLLNVIKLNVGEAMFLGPNNIHAYLKGDCIECMACSDNVVRAGLTPKYQDVETLVAMLDYDMAPADTRRFKATELDDCCQLFDPPVPDFAVEAITVPSSKPYTLRSVDSCSLLLVVAGEATTGSSNSESAAIQPPSRLARGSVLFLPANYTFTVTPGEGQTLVAFRALCQ